MAEVDNKNRLEQRIPQRVVDELYQIARKYRSKGAHLFIFGSIAESRDKRTSDLDLGIEWEGDRSAEIYRQLREEIWNLPTIRKIDLVDMSRVNEEFEKQTKNHRIYLE